MDTRLLLVSHAATAAQRAGRFPADDPLDARGRVEAEAARPRLALPADGAVFTSPAASARETAVALGLSATPADALADTDYGKWRGQRLADIADATPRELAAWTREPDAAPPGGESFGQLVQRVGEWLDAQQADLRSCNAVNEASFAASAQGRTIVAVTHATLLRAAIVHALGASPTVFCRIEIAPLSVVELRHSRRGWSWWPAASA
ncbi:broad specificity phosphatase PhoE [Paraburkholderia sp. HC6.4b]|uniref:histidine phosphatase family protein n=1 Tax=unclassified Paraburkholderia TaxID=2615204 RepID=UPI0016171287|nr:MULTISPECIES: histidine phosphatase family protein [unclassified Paraburkholderia]MBB5406551.1 broad specificity phosphatase PhoE [Paraburkholderia sp. HC6.4b]MBB5449379.1 broad specificity phosphatase PhoE [Paraburkholderia sp. Kb1A]